MAKPRGEQIRQFILDNVESHPRDVATLAASAYGISRQAVNKHIQKLVADGALTTKGTTKDRHYLLHRLVEWEKVFQLAGLAEDIIWRVEVRPLLGELPSNVLDIWHYGFTEMLNNAIDHSDGTVVVVQVKKNASSTEVTIYDNGIGIFEKIKESLDLLDERHAVLELAKGKLTTDPDRHSGEGIFFSSRMFDSYAILSGNVYFSHKHDEIEDWIFENKKAGPGTGVFMRLSNNSPRKQKDVFDSFTSDEDYGFTKTVIPVHLAQYGNEKLVSRSQAKRLLARVEKFKTVIFDFTEIDTIGQAFADEVFRVFRAQNTNVELLYMNASREVEQMISRANAKDKEEKKGQI